MRILSTSFLKSEKNISFGIENVNPMIKIVLLFSTERGTQINFLSQKVLINTFVS